MVTLQTLTYHILFKIVVGDLFKVVVTVKNKLLSAERISIAVNFDDNMFLTGPVSSALEVCLKNMKTLIIVITFN